MKEMNRTCVSRRLYSLVECLASVIWWGPWATCTAGEIWTWQKEEEQMRGRERWKMNRKRERSAWQNKWNDREEKHCAEQPASCCVLPGESFVQHTHTNRHTWWHVINIVVVFFCSGSYRGVVHQLHSLELQMCGRHSRGKAPQLTTLLIKTCRPAIACVCLCVPVCACCPVCLCVLACFFPFPLVFGECVCPGTRALTQVRAGNDAVYEIGIIYLGCGGSCRGLPQLEMSKHGGKSLWSIVEWRKCVCVLFNVF